MFHLRIIEYFGDGIDRPSGYPADFEFGQPFITVARQQYRLNQWHQYLPITHSGSVGGISGILGPLRPPHQLGQARELARATTRSHQMAISAGNRRVRNNSGLRFTVTLGRKPTDQGIERLVRQSRHLLIKQRYIDMAPFPRALTLMKARQPPNRGVKSG